MTTRHALARTVCNALTRHAARSTLSTSIGADEGMLRGHMPSCALRAWHTTTAFALRGGSAVCVDGDRG